MRFHWLAVVVAAGLFYGCGHPPAPNPPQLRVTLPGQYSDAETLFVWLDQSGKALFAGHEISFDQLIDEITRLQLTDPKQAISISGDAPHSVVQDFMSSLQGAGLIEGVPTKREDKS